MLGVVGWLLLAGWVFGDAWLRREAPLPWGLLALLTGLVGVAVYLVSRRYEPRRCPQCGQQAQGDFLFCPHCGEPLWQQCESCGGALMAGWSRCPYCAALVGKVGDGAELPPAKSGGPDLGAAKSDGPEPHTE